MILHHCETCAFFEETPSSEIGGRCCESPPRVVVVDGDVLSWRPEVGKTDGCGRHSEIQRQDEERKTQIYMQGLRGDVPQPVMRGMILEWPATLENCLDCGKSATWACDPPEDSEQIAFPFCDVCVTRHTDRCPLPVAFLANEGVRERLEGYNRQLAERMSKGRSR